MQYVYKAKKILPHSFSFWLLAVLALLLTIEGCYELFLMPPAADDAAPPSQSQVATLQAPRMPLGAGVPTSLNMGMPGAPTSITSLQAPRTAASVKHFTLTAQPARLALGAHATTPAWTFNGTAPGPTLRVRQGDLVTVNLVNHLSFGVTIHWHGVSVPNSADGVAGVTQDAVKPGQTYTYRFIAKDAGTYWYHSHQFSYEETTDGLYGMLVVDPAKPTIHADVDYSVALHEWSTDNQTTLVMNTSTGTLNVAAHPGQWVRLRIVNTTSTASGMPQLVTLLGTRFKVVSLDGHDLYSPDWLDETPLPIATAQRYDLLFQMPTHGAVSLLTSSDNQHYQTTPAAVIGQGVKPATLPAVDQRWFDFNSYGRPTKDTITVQSHFDAAYGIVLGNQMGSSLGRMGMTYTLNGKVFPDTGMIMLKEGQLVKLHFDNKSDLYHPMHLHGHVFTVLAHNGRPLTGSPVHLDTITVPPHESYDVAFYANNPGIWMLHCHNFLHANWGMDMMVMYDVSTPYTVGTASGNFPD